MIGLDLETAELLPALDGSVTVRAALEARARETGLDADRLARAALPVVRRLFELGYLKLQSSAAGGPPPGLLESN